MAQSAPRELPETTLTRQASDPFVRNLVLSKNFSRTESYQANYEESVPYQVEETYYENVTYEVDEPYQELEIYTQYERVCRTRTRTRRECRTVRECRQSSHPIWQLLLGAKAYADDETTLPAQRRERPNPGRGDNDARRPAPSPNRPRPEPPRPQPPAPKPPAPRPEPPRPQPPAPKPPAPRPEPPRPQPPAPRPPTPKPPTPKPPVCQDVERCTNVPETYQDCNWENVPHQRWVTRYRRVTRTRSEPRTRTVTRYRTETRCCVTRTRTVFDRQWEATVTLRFPEEAVLMPKEKETFQVKLVGDENNPQLVIDLRDTVFGYEPKVRIVNANTFEVEMRLRPKYSSVQLGQGSLENLSIVESNGENLLILQDGGTRPRVLSLYHVQLVDPRSATVLDESSWSVEGAAGTQERPLRTSLPAGSLVQIRLSVQRTSLLLDQPVAFTQDARLEVEEDANYDTASYMDPNQTGKFSVQGRGEKTKIWFRDLTEDIPQVRTEYSFRISDSKGAVLVEKTFRRDDLKVDTDGRLKLSLKDDFGATEETLARLKSGLGLVIEYQAIRHGRKFEPNPYTIKKTVRLSVP